MRAVGGGRFVAYLAGPDAGRRGPLRLVSGDRAAYADVVVGALERTVRGVPDARVMLVGGAHGGAMPRIPIPKRRNGESCTCVSLPLCTLSTPAMLATHRRDGVRGEEAAGGGPVGGEHWCPPAHPPTHPH